MQAPALYDNRDTLWLPRWSLLIHIGFCHAVFILLWLYMNYDSAPLIYPACCLYLCLIVWSLLSWKAIGGRLLSPYILFLIAAALFNGGQLLLEAFHMNRNGILDNQFSPDALMRTILFVLICMSFMHLGALLSRVRSDRSGLLPPLATDSVRKTDTDDRAIRIVGWSMFLIAFVPTVFLLKDAIVKVMDGNVLALYGNDDPTGFGAIPFLLSKLLIPAALFILAGSCRSRSGIAISFFIVVAYTFIMLVLGLRSGAIMPFIAYAWLYDRLVKRLPRLWIVLFGSFIFFIVFPAIAVLRTQNMGSLDLVNDLLALDNPAVAIMSEVGNSMLTVAHTMDLIPLVREYDMGQGYMYALLTIVPNLFWDLHPSVAHGLAADWLGWQIDPGYASIGGGYGFSFIAESYFNFGWFGALLIGTFGYGFAGFSRKVEEGNDAAKFAMLACFLSFFLIIARGETASIVRPLVWYSLLPYFGVFIAKVFTRSYSPKEPGG